MVARMRFIVTLYLHCYFIPTLPVLLISVNKASICFLLIKTNKKMMKIIYRSLLITVQRDPTQSILFIILQVHSTCFGCQPHPSSGVHKTVTTHSGTGHIFCAVTSLQRGQASLATLEEFSRNLCTEQSPTESDDTRCCTNTIVLLRMRTIVLETCTGM